MIKDEGTIGKKIETCGRRYLKSFLLLFLLSAVIETFVFNYRHWETIGNAPYIPDHLSMGEGYIDNSDGTYTIGDGSLDIEIKDINGTLSNAYIDIEIINLPEDEVRPVTLWQKAKDYSHKKYYNLSGKELWPEEERSKYMTYHLYGECSSLLLTPATLGQGDVISAAISLNPVIPMFFSWERILYCFLILSSVYLFRPRSELYRIRYMELTGTCRKTVTAIVFLVLMGVSWKMTTMIPLFQNDPWDNYQGYQHLAEALANGSFSLMEEPSETLKNMDNPYDSEFRYDEMTRTGEGFLWDHAYYNGKYYIYFGVVPALLFYLPYYLLTGHHLMNHIVIFITAGFYFAGVMALFHELIRRWYRNCSAGIWFISLMLFLLGSQCFYLIKRPDIYAVPIFTAAAFGVWGIGFFLKAQKECCMSVGYLFAGSLCIALTAGCRPQQFLFFGIACILLGKKFFSLSYWRTPDGGRAVFAVAAPMLAVASALMYYNYARFGSVFDFGANYNLTLNDMRYRGWVWDRVPLGLVSYFFWPIRLMTHYPFIEPVYHDSDYMGVTIQEPAYGGIFAIAPFFILCVCAFVFSGELKRLNRTAWLIAVYSVLAAVVIAVADTQMAGIVMRYYTDFAPFLGLAALIVVWSVLEKENSGSCTARAVIFFLLACYLYEFIFHGLKLTVDVASAMREQRPELYAHFKYLTSFWL